MSLFKLGDFTSAAGFTLAYKIECEALDEGDWACIAKIAADLLPPFADVFGVPTGGLPLELALRPYRGRGQTLLVDDVWTTGRSMRAFASALRLENWIGFVAFARGPLPAQVRCFLKEDDAMRT